MSKEKKINVLVVDDSALMRNLVSRIIESAPELAVAGTAMNGEFALQKIPRLNPDIIVLDLEMPKMNGIEFLQARRDQGIDIPVIILSSIAQKGARITMEALSLGASDFISKPSGAVSHDLHVVGDQLVTMIRAYGGEYLRSRGETPPEPPRDYATRVPRHEEAPPREIPGAAPAEAYQPPQKPVKKSPQARPGTLEIIALGISTGGPNALRRVFADLDGNIGVPILVVQHMPPGFTTEFAASLNRICPLEVLEASDGDLIKPGRVLIAPGNYHMEVNRRPLGATVTLNQGDPCNGHRPSAGVLFKSVARAYGNQAMAILMTGMGRDGAWEIGEIYEAGGMTIGQDEQSSIVYGMPRVAWENGYIHRQASLDNMAETINAMARSLR
ncbi:protein-glutamate methylesterase/protein-glutamine glutaminase [Alkalispirochaeta sphaeroplastigenens]|nr:chemotaxis response regulator protein-glutamate methylesterase [Alkalispirochaeta sphaeroplastigenens]